MNLAMQFYYAARERFVDRPDVRIYTRTRFADRCALAAESAPTRTSVSVPSLSCDVGHFGLCAERLRFAFDNAEEADRG